MTHLTFYRKYRSQNFDELVGQTHIVQTLKNAIEHDRLSHAYIFSGPRGTGKTSIARIFAKTLNCTEGMSMDDCPICAHITSGNCVDVIEMDAASNTGVDHIRVLNEQVKFAPVECGYKLFIIDEAHMLSSGAFNALLKTMEEPPENTIFILATTEPQKIPVTIHSRCQHLQFKKLSTEEIISQLQHIATQEGISIPEKGLQVLARNASGCMRDAISLLDQVYSFKGKTITEEDIFLILGSSGFDHLVNLMTAFYKQDVEETVRQLQEIFDGGANILQLTQEITSFIKFTLFAKLDLKKALDLDDGRIATLKQISQPIDTAVLKELLEEFAKVEMDLRWFPNPQLLLQIRFLHFLQTQQDAQPNPSSHDSFSETQFKQTAPKQEKPTEFANEVVPPRPEPIDVKPVGDVKVIDKGGVQHDAPTIKPTVQKEVPSPTTPNTLETSQANAKPASIIGDISQKIAQEPVMPSPQQKTQSPIGETKPVNEQAVSAFHKDSWDRVISYTKEHKPGLFFIISGSKVLSVTDEQITIVLAQNYKFTQEKLKENAVKQFLSKAIQTIFNKPMGLSLENMLIFSAPGKQPQTQNETGSVTGQTTASQTPEDQGSSDATDNVDNVDNVDDDVSVESKKVNTIIDIFEGKVVD